MAERITAGRARMLNRARPKWVMVGLDWDGPGVLLMASDRLTRARLDFEARQYDFRDLADLAANFTPSLALTAIIDTRPAEGSKDGWVLIAAPDWIQAMQALFGEWTPDTDQRALPAPPAGSANAAVSAPVTNAIATHSHHRQD
jgi:hypothetical protein